MRRKMWRLTALCLAALLCVAVHGAAAPEPRIFDDTDVLPAGGRDILGSTGPELVAALGDPTGREFLYYEGATGDGVVLWIYDGMTVHLRTSDPALCDAMADLTDLPYDEPSLVAFDVEVTQAGIPGPRGIEVGMPMDEVLALFPRMEDMPDYGPEWITLYRNPLSVDDPENSALRLLPPSGVLITGWDGEEGEDTYDTMLSLTTIDPAFYTETVQQNGWTLADYLYHPVYTLNVYAADGTVKSFALYRGALAE